VVIPGAAHHALLERPEAYGAHLEAFLQAHEDSGSIDQKRHR
jgi:pimeloyl-ACP methyl ester carboxylesterase